MTKDHDASKRIAEVLRLSLTEGLPIRAISRRLQMSRKTVRDILRRPYTPPSKAPSSSSDERRPSLLDSYDPILRQLLHDTPELRAPAILEKLRKQGYQGGISILRDRLRELRPRAPREAFLTLDFAPGEALQVDWADFGFALPGCPRRVSAFVMTLCYSRYLYLEFTVSQTMGTFLRCMERGVRFLGGVTAVDIFDNMKTVVQSHTPKVTVFNPRFLEYAQARGGFTVVACNPRRPQEKGRVERSIGFVRERFYTGRRFSDLLDLNRQATAWRDEFANHRVHEKTGKIPALVFEHEEKRALRPLPETPFDTDDTDSQGVTKTFRITFDRNTYSVPWRLVGQTVLVRANDQSVAVFLGPKQVALHQRCWSAGKDIEHPSHKAELLAHKPRAAASGALPQALEGLGEVGQRYFKTLAATHRSLQRESVRLTFLVEIFGQSITSDAMHEVMATGHVGAEYVEYVLRKKKGIIPAPPPLRLGDPVLDALSFHEPDLSIYDRLPPTMTLDPGTPPAQEPSSTKGTPYDEGRR